MIPHRIACEGFPLGSFWVPPFQLHPSEIICLHLPFSPDSAETERLIQILTGARAEPALHAFGRIACAQPARIQRKSWVPFFREETARGWLQHSTHGALSSEAILSRLGVQGSWKVSQLGYNQRLLLGLEAAFQNRADAIVFSTVGGDPTGFSLAVEWFSEKRQWTISGIYLSYSFMQNGQMRRFCFPGGKCLEVSIQPVTPLPLNSITH